MKQIENRSYQDLLITSRFPVNSEVKFTVLDEDNIVSEKYIMQTLKSTDVQLFVPAVQKQKELFVLVTHETHTDTCKIFIHPVPRFDLYLIMHTHTDLGYTQPQVELIDLHTSFIDQAIDYVKMSKNRPLNEQFRWTCETTWAVQHFLDSRSPTRISELLDCVASGHIEITGLYHNQTALSGYEEMERMAAVAQEIKNRYGIQIRSAMNSDVNGIPRGWIPILNSIGVRYLNMAVNWTKGGPPFRDLCPNGFYWVAPDNSRLLVWNSDGYQKGNQLGILSGTEDTPLMVSKEYSRLIAEGFPHSFISVQIQGIGGDNRPPNLEICDFVSEWNALYSNPKMRISTSGDFFDRLNDDEGNSLPVTHGEWPDWWSDGVGSTAIETGLSRQAGSFLARVGALSALNYDRETAREIENLYLINSIFNEHTWGGHNSVDEPWAPYNRMIWNWKAGHVYRAWHGALKLGERLLAKYSTGKPYEILAFNPHATAYHGPVKVAVYRRGRSILKNGYQIKDEDGSAVAAEWLPGSDWAHLMLDLQIEPLGFRRLVIEPGSERIALSSSCVVNKSSVESPFYRLSWDHKGITSLYDKRISKELIDPDSPFRFGSVIYETLPNPDGGRSGRMILENPDGNPQFARNSVKIDSIRVLESGNKSTIVRLSGRSNGFQKLQTDIRLYDHFPRMDVKVTFLKMSDYRPEAVYVPFPIKISEPDVHLDLPGFVGYPWKDQLPQTCEDYFLVQNWVAVSDEEYGVILVSNEAPLFQFGKLRTGDWNKSGPPANGTILSWPMNTYWYTNFAALQEPHQEFNYSLTSYSGLFDPHRAITFARDCVAPPIAFYYRQPRKGNLELLKTPAISLDPKELIIESVLPNPNGNGIQIRIREVDGRNVKGTIRMSDNFRMTKCVIKGREFKSHQSEYEYKFNIKPYESLTLEMFL